MSLSGEAPFDPRRYHEQVTGERTEVAKRPPVCLYLEVTNRCNLLCTTCPRTYADLEPPADMDWDRFRSIVDVRRHPCSKWGATLPCSFLGGE